MRCQNLTNRMQAGRGLAGEQICRNAQLTFELNQPDASPLVVAGISMAPLLSDQRSETKSANHKDVRNRPLECELIQKSEGV